ncbi:MAG TPA: MarR family transcriptional regulator [Acidimicrobiia bacterium]|nr:MarR family transcriptional regulator [Acidimicrobiia bacterium]
MARRGETLEAINDLLASATIFTSTSSDLLAAELENLAGDRLTFAQLRLLRLVARQDPLSVGDVATFLGISNAAASKAVDRLVRGGFLRRAEAKEDRRTTEVSMTEESRVLLDDFDARSSVAWLRLLSGVTPRQMRDISGGLDRLSLSISGPADPGRSVCFRCGLYFRDECLLRTMTDRQCYMHLGSRRRGGEKPKASHRSGAGRRQAGVTIGGGG